MLDPVKAGTSVTPLMTVGDVLNSGYRYEAIPDGISVRPRGHGRLDLFINHETSKVPFPFVRAAPAADNGENDFDNAQVTRLNLNRHSAGVLGGKFVIPSSLGYQRFCSNFLNREGRLHPRHPLHQRGSPDYVFRQEDSWPPPIGDPNEEEVGLVVALDVKNGKSHPISGMGRHNHENAVAIPGYGKPVVLSGDDTFTSGPAPRRGVLAERAGAVAALLVHRVEHEERAGRQGRPVGVRLGHAGREELLRRASGLGRGCQGPFHQGPEEHRDR